MRYFAFSLTIVILTAGSGSAGWIQFVDPADPGVMVFDVYRGTYADANWESSFAVDQFKAHWGLLSPTEEGIDWGLDSVDLVREGSLGRSGEVESYPALGIYPSDSHLSGLRQGSPDEFTPTRLRMPEPVSMIVWAILGAAWAGLAWHRRPIHRGPQWTGQFPLEEGTRWTKENRQAILDVIKRNHI